MPAEATAEATPTSSESSRPRSSGPLSAWLNELSENHSGPWANRRGLNATSRNSTIGSTSMATISTQNAVRGAAWNRPVSTRSPCRRDAPGRDAGASRRALSRDTSYFTLVSNHVLTWFSSGPQKYGSSFW